MAGIVQRESDRAIGNTVITVSSTDDLVDLSREDATAAVIVIDSNNEVLVLRRKGATWVINISSSNNSISIPEEVATVVVIVINSNNEVLVPRGKESTWAVEYKSSNKSNRDADYIPSEEASSDNKGDSSTVKAEASKAEYNKVR